MSTDPDTFFQVRNRRFFMEFQLRPSQSAYSSLLAWCCKAASPLRTPHPARPHLQAAKPALTTFLRFLEPSRPRQSPRFLPLTSRNDSVTRRMNRERRTLIAKKACTRCSTQKRRCDRALPDCGLCTRYKLDFFLLFPRDEIPDSCMYRLHQICKYGLHQMSSPGGSGSTPSPSPMPGVLYGSTNLTPSHLKASIIEKFGTTTPETTVPAYCREIEPWFPLISLPRLWTQLPQTWEEVPLDVAFLCLSITLLTSTPTSSLEAEESHDDLKSLYLYIKSSLSATEGLGMNSLLIVQSRILVTLFEVAHGLYPAAYISIGTTARAVDALQVHPEGGFAPSKDLDGGAKGDETLLTWGGILILDRYISAIDF